MLHLLFGDDNYSKLQLFNFINVAIFSLLLCAEGVLNTAPSRK